MIVDENGKNYKLGEKLGQGGQGVVYRVSSDTGLAVKGIFRPLEGLNKIDGSAENESWILQDEKLYEKYAEKIHALMALGIFYDIEHIALPKAVLAKPNCGYVMWLMEGLEEIENQMPGRNNFIPQADENSGLGKKIRVLYGLAQILQRLHTSGLIYCDLSPSNIYVSKSAKDHEVWLIDSDNLIFVNRARRSVGTPGYRAPEIATQKSRNTFYSDMYSFALVAFRYLTGESPFGETVVERDWDDEDGDDDFAEVSDDGSAEYMYEGKGPIWGIPLSFVCTEEMQTLFYRTFCKTGRENPTTRPNASEWCEVLDDALNRLNYCFEDVADQSSAKGKKKKVHEFFGHECVWCKDLGKNAQLPELYRISVVPSVCEEEEWENTEPAPLKKYCVCSTDISCMGGKGEFERPLKYLTGIESARGNNTFSIVFRADQVIISPRITQDIVLYLNHKNCDGKIGKPGVGKKIEVTVVTKYSMKGNKKGKIKAIFTLERIR